MSLLESDVEQLLRQFHSVLLKENEHDEGDLIFYRINYRLADSLHISKDDAEKLHLEYHRTYPRKISEGYCEKCQKLVTLLPIIYGIQKSELAKMQAREREGRLIIGDASIIREGSKVAMFGCKSCRSSLPTYGTL